MATIAVIAAFAVVAGRLTVRGEVFPGVEALATPLGGMSEAEARAALEARAVSLAASPFELVFEDRVWTMTLADLGLAIDVEASLREAMGYGREHHRVSGVLRPLRLFEGPVGSVGEVRIDRPRLESTLRASAVEAGIAPVEAVVAVVDGEARLTAGRAGLLFDAAAVEERLIALLDRGEPLSIILETRTGSPSMTDDDLAMVQAELDERLSEPFVFTHRDQEWPVEPDEIARLIVVTGAPTGDSPVLALDRERVDQFGERLAADVEQIAADAHLDDSGRVPRVVAGRAGRTLRTDDFAAAMETAFAAGEHRLALPIDEVEPAVTTEDVLAELGVTNLLAEGVSEFAGSDEGRATNVRVATELVDGVLVAPGETFSFNQAIGSIVEQPGFVPAGGAEGGFPRTSVGGGVCQVTTSVFRAALKAGLPIVEWWPHAYRILYYEQGGWAPGFDASIDQPDGDPFGGTDFRFTNPTDGWLLVRAEIVGGKRLVVGIYGPATGYVVELHDPIYENIVFPSGTIEEVDQSLPSGTIKELEPARDGVTMTVYRQVYDEVGNLLLDDAFVSVYQPQGAHYRVSPDMSGATGGE